MHCGPPNQNFGWAGPPGLPCSAPMGSGRRCKLSQRGPGRSPDEPTAVAFCCIECFQNASGCSIFCYLVSIAMSGKMKANPSSGLIWYLLATYAINIFHIRLNWQVNFCKVRNCGPLNFAALFGRTPRTCLRPTLLVRVA